jgi:hypothetical protein
MQAQANHGGGKGKAHAVVGRRWHAPLRARRAM